MHYLLQNKLNMLMKHKMVKRKLILKVRSVVMMCEFRVAILRIHSSTLKISFIKFIRQITINAMDYPQYDSDVLMLMIQNPMKSTYKRKQNRINFINMIFD